jgi:RNA polymerase sigma-70 factor (ECF subfamily)
VTDHRDWQIDPAAGSNPVVEDATLLQRLGDGDEHALEAVYDRYGGSCYRLARRILDDPHLAQDVVQQVFLALWQGSGYDPARGAVSTWLMSVTHHKAVDMLRREAGRRKRLTGDQQLIERQVSGLGPPDQAWATLRTERTREALRTLTAEHREVLLLAYYGGYTQREIADMTGLPLGTVKSRTLHAMRRLRVDLSGEDGMDEGVEL